MDDRSHLAQALQDIADALIAKDAEIKRLLDESKQLRAHIRRDNEHYEAAMVMAEKHRKNWVEECQKRARLVKLLHDLREGNEKPGDTVLRAMEAAFADKEG